MRCLGCLREKGDDRHFCGAACIEKWQEKYGCPEGRPWSQEQ